ncbi:DUF3305 domain-containing protein [Roseovarius aquimarinus]|uniref:DUF3305 domain-containing protein n=1 Tax=Roseovarius aquimarinus TaxID=1229156 RepID=A0ABW7I923_9RHOB
MPRDVFRVAVVGVSHPPANKWARRSLRPAAILAAIPALERGSVMTEQGEVLSVYLGDFSVQLHSGETSHYFDNLSAAQPSLWVAMDGAEVKLVTADPYEGEALASDPERVVEALAMPPAIMARVRSFAEAHHKQETFHKRRRSAAMPDEDPRAPRILSEEDKWVTSRGKAGLPPKAPR